MNYLQLSLFVLGTIIICWYCRKQLRNPECHGFYRCFAFIGVLLLIILNIPVWTNNIFSPLQLASWALLHLSLFLIIYSAYLFKIKGGHSTRNAPAEHFGFENTTTLITNGIYKYIRHPMYTSLLLFLWGVLFKQITLIGLIAALASSLFLVITAIIEERENIAFFGNAYRSYQKTSKMFMPYVW